MKVVAQIGTSPNAPFPFWVHASCCSLFWTVALRGLHKPCLIHVSVFSWSACFSYNSEDFHIFELDYCLSEVACILYNSYLQGSYWCPWPGSSVPTFSTLVILAPVPFALYHVFASLNHSFQIICIVSLSPSLALILGNSSVPSFLMFHRGELDLPLLPQLDPSALHHSEV